MFKFACLYLANVLTLDNYCNFTTIQCQTIKLSKNPILMPNRNTSFETSMICSHSNKQTSCEHFILWCWDRWVCFSGNLSSVWRLKDVKMTLHWLDLINTVPGGGGSLWLKWLCKACNPYPIYLALQEKNQNPCQKVYIKTMRMQDEHEIKDLVTCVITSLCSA